VVLVEKGEEGDWTNLAKCDKGEFIKSVRIKNEEKKTFSDNTGINGFQFQCGNVDKFTDNILFNGPFGKMKKNIIQIPFINIFLTR
jgi:hypothetical protein